MPAAVREGTIDAVYRTLTTADLDDLAKQRDVKVHTGSGNGIRYVVLDFATQPYGTKTKNADPKKALADRELLDRAVEAWPRTRLAVVRGGPHHVLNDLQHRSVAAEVVTFLEALRNDLVPAIAVGASAW